MTESDAGMNDRIDLIDSVFASYREAAGMGPDEETVVDFLADFVHWARANGHELSTVFPRALEHALREVVDPRGEWVFEHGPEQPARHVQSSLSSLGRTLASLAETAEQSHREVRPGLALVEAAAGCSADAEWDASLDRLWKDAVRIEPELMPGALAYPAFARAVPTDRLEAALHAVPESVRGAVFAILGRRKGGRGR